MLTSLNLRHQTLRPVATLDGCDASQGRRTAEHFIRLQSFPITYERCSARICHQCPNCDLTRSHPRYNVQQCQRISMSQSPSLSAANEATSTIWHPAQLHPSDELLFSTHGPPDTDEQLHDSKFLWSLSQSLHQTAVGDLPRMADAHAY
mgnify:CR=1 FL=1